MEQSMKLQQYFDPSLTGQPVPRTQRSLNINP